MNADRIFIHAWWRSGSTYIWSKLRKNDNLICYYEPLHEKNARLTMEVINKPADIELSRLFRHPQQSKNYFAEYATLVRSNRLKFSPALSYDRFLLRPNQIDDELRIYIDRLLRAASGANRVAVLCFCRSQMRSAWIRRLFGGVHIAQIRNPSDQWASFKVEPYFRNKMLIIALKLRQLHPASFLHIEAFERFARHMAKHPTQAVEQLFDAFIAEKDSLAVFLVIWIASALQAISYADFVLDIDRLSTDRGYQKTASHWFETAGCPLNFADCSSPSACELPVPGEGFERMLDDAATAIRTGAASLVIADYDVVKKRMKSLSPLSNRVLCSAVPV
jgi:hypothetical protein